MACIGGCNSTVPLGTRALITGEWHAPARYSVVSVERGGGVKRKTETVFVSPDSKGRRKIRYREGEASQRSEKFNEDSFVFRACPRLEARNGARRNLRLA